VPRRARWLELTNFVAQIALAIVAIFGYFYTVRPIYQKEQLAEQVAEYEGIIKKQTPKIVEIEQRLAGLQRERDQLTAEVQRERSRLTADLQNIQRQLAAARDEKKRVEEQIQFMTYRYSLPDGRPAVTREQVQTAQEFNLRRSVLSSISLRCGLGLRDPVFLSYSYDRDDGKNKFWPFTEQEINTWKEYGSKYPLKRALECIESEVSSFRKEYTQVNFSSIVESARLEAVQFANQAATAKAWAAPVQPADVMQELAAKRPTIQSALVAELKKVEDEYGDWESAFGGDRRAIYKHNYSVGKQNAETNALNSRMTVNAEAQGKANAFRKSLLEEVARLIVDFRKVGQK